MSEMKNRSKWQLFIMIAMVAGVIIAGFLVFPKTDEQRSALLDKLGTTNHGELLFEPLELKQLALTDTDGNAWDFDNQKIKWRLIIVGNDACEPECQQMLTVTRGVHLRLGKKAHRFERILLTTNTQTKLLSDQFKEAHPYLKIMMVDETQLKSWLATKELASHLTPGLALLVDQKGLAMMRYGSEHEGGRMLEDLNHLLKYSPAK